MIRGRKGGLNVQLWQKASLSTGRVGLPTGLQPNDGWGEIRWPSTLTRRDGFLLGLTPSAEIKVLYVRGGGTFPLSAPRRAPESCAKGGATLLAQLPDCWRPRCPVGDLDVFRRIRQAISAIKL